MYLQGVDNVYDLQWAHGVTYGDVHHQGEIENSVYNFDESDQTMLFSMFDMCEAESKRLIAKELVLPAYDYCLKCSHLFNLLDARGAISVAERTRFIGRVRDLARVCSLGYLAQRERMGYPLLKRWKNT
jgi:glycyl-tRNA synthetase alpha chain